MRWKKMEKKIEKRIESESGSGSGRERKRRERRMERRDGGVWTRRGTRGETDGWQRSRVSRDPRRSRKRSWLPPAAA